MANPFFSNPSKKHIAVLFALGLILGLALFYALNTWEHPNRTGQATIGMTFSTQYAASLKLDPRQVFTAFLDDLHIRQFRIPVYWNDVETKSGSYDWSSIDWILDQAATHGATVTLVLGRKVPRWPECHEPDWVDQLSAKDQQAATLAWLTAEVAHFKDAPAIKVWQVENEPLFAFGHCPPPDRDFLKQEVALVRKLDPSHPIQITDSGELSTWVRTATLADQLGISMYRLVWNSYLGELYWPVSPLFYTDRISAFAPVVRHVIVSELQAEPWFRKGVFETPIPEQLDSMSVQRMRDNVAFAEQTGVSEIDMWGGEWWYWMRTQGHPEFWEAGRKLYQP